MADNADDSTELPPELLEIVEDFEKALELDSSVQVADYLCRGSEMFRLALLLELVLVQQDHDWHHENCRAWQQYLEDWPELLELPRAVPQLQTQQCELEGLLGKTAAPSQFLAKPTSQRSWMQRYDFQRELGSGSFGTVYLAIERALNRKVAIKVPAKSKRTLTDSQAGRHQQVAQESLAQEARAISKLKHRHIAPLLEFSFSTDPMIGWYLIYEYIEGGTLQERLKSGALAPALAVSITAKLADALHHAHQQRLIHRDIKPANILLDTNDEPYLADFGLAASKEEILRGANPGAGTLAYMSPEQVRSERPTITYRTDIFSLGAVLYEMLCGQRPFVAHDAKTLIQLIVDQPLDSLWVNNPHTNLSERAKRDLDAICKAALKKPPDARYDNAAYMANELRDALKHLPQTSNAQTDLPSGSPREIGPSSPDDSGPHILPRRTSPFDELNDNDFQRLKEPSAEALIEVPSAVASERSPAGQIAPPLSTVLTSDVLPLAETIHVGAESDSATSPQTAQLAVAPVRPQPPRRRIGKTVIAMTCVAGAVVGFTQWPNMIGPTDRTKDQNRVRLKVDPDRPPPPRSRAELTETTFDPKTMKRGVILVAKFPDGLALNDSRELIEFLKPAAENCTVSTIEDTSDSEGHRCVKLQVVPLEDGVYALRIPSGLKAADGSYEYDQSERFERRWSTPTKPLELTVQSKSGAYCRTLRPCFHVVVDGELSKIEELSEAIREASKLMKSPSIAPCKDAVAISPGYWVYDLTIDVPGDDETERKVELVIPQGAAITIDGRSNERVQKAIVNIDTKPPLVRLGQVTPNQRVVSSDTAIDVTLGFDEPVSAKDVSAIKSPNAEVKNWKPTRAGEFVTEMQFVLKPIASGSVSVLIDPPFAADRAGNELATTQKPLLTFDVIPAQTWVREISSQIAVQVEGRNATELKALHKKTDDELNRISRSTPMWPLRMLRAAIAFELARDETLISDDRIRIDSLNKARDEYLEVAKPWKIQDQGMAFDDAAFLVWILAERAKVLGAKFPENETPLNDLIEVGTLLDKLRGRPDFANLSVRVQSMWFYVRWEGASYENWLRQRDPKTKPTKEETKLMIQLLIESFRLYPTARVKKDVEHYVSAQERPKIDQAQAASIDAVLKIPVKEGSLFDHASRIADAYEREFIARTQK